MMEAIAERKEDEELSQPTSRNGRSTKSTEKSLKNYWQDRKLLLQMIFYKYSLFFTVDEKTKAKLWYKVFHEIFISSSMPNLQTYLYDHGFKKRKLFWFALLCVDVVLRGVSQVFLCNHPLCGVLVCIGLAFTSYKLPLFALLGSTCSSFSAVTVARPPKEDILAGLCGYDGALVGCACLTFLAEQSSPLATVLLSLIGGTVHVACTNLMKIWQLPSFTFAFNIVTIMILFAVKGDKVEVRFSQPSSVTYPDDFTDMSLGFVVDATIRGVGQFMFADTTVGSAFVIAGIAMCSRKGAIIAVLGSIVGWVVSYYVLDVSNKINVRTGLYGYNCAGTCCVLAGGIFYKASDGAALVGVIGACLAALLTVGIQGALDGLPVLTFPFILSAWMTMLSRSKWLDESSDGILRPLMKRISSRHLPHRPLHIPFLDYHPHFFSSHTSSPDRSNATLQRMNSSGILQRMRSSSISLFNSPAHSRMNSAKVAAGYDMEQGHIVSRGNSISLFSAASPSPSKRGSLWARGNSKPSFKDVAKAVVETQREMREEEQIIQEVMTNTDRTSNVYAFDHSDVEE